MPVSSVKLADYQPPAFTVDCIDLSFDLYDDYAMVENRMQLRALSGNRTLSLQGEDLELVAITLNGNNLSNNDYDLTESNLIIPDVPENFSLIIISKIKPQLNTHLSGLYRSNTMFCTQCEAQGFRRITYFFDRPDVLTVYTTKVIADKQKFPVLLSNGNPVNKGELDNDRHFAKWHDPFKKPSYLFALVAGDLVCVQDRFVTMSGREIDLQIFVESGNEDKCSHAMKSLKKAMKWDEEQFGREYDLDIFMIVAVSDFNMGAMENKGLNIFNSKYILANPQTATDRDYAGIEGVVAHEYFHNWTGNRITCRDWFQLSLKEGLTVFRDQEFSRDMNSREVNRIQDVRVLRNFQFVEDAGPTAHPVRPESYIEINNFYTSTIYNKGAEVIRMQQALLGKEGFSRGMDLYFERHDGQAVTIDDFVACMSDANDKDLTQFKRWYSQAGTPVVKAVVHYEQNDNKLVIELTQSCRPTVENNNKQNFVIPIQFALFTQNGERIKLDDEVMALSDKSQSFVFDGITDKPVVSLLRDFSAPVTLDIEYSDEELLLLMKAEDNGFARWEASQRLALKYLLKMVEKPDANVLTDQVCDTYRALLLDYNDPALTAELLLVPGFEDIARSISCVDVDKVLGARKLYVETIGQVLFEEFQALYRQLWSEQSEEMSAKAYGLRSLQNVCLAYMMKSNPHIAFTECMQQYHQAKTMTDVVASLALLVDHDSEQSDEAIDDFYQKWQQDDLVLDKWFSIQAQSQADNCLAKVEKLLEHPAFSMKNPNKVRSLIGAFCQGNPKHFHHQSGNGYAFVAKKVLELDKINPQIAARLVTPLLRWQKFDDNRQKIMKTELEAMIATGDLSKDLYEMVSRSL